MTKTKPKNGQKTILKKPKKKKKPQYTHSSES